MLFYNSSCQAGLVWSGSACSCPSGWNKNGNSCYLRVDTARTFNDAQLDCISKNGLLANIDTEDKYSYVMNYRTPGQNIFVILFKLVF